MRRDINGLDEATRLSLSHDEYGFDVFKIRTSLADANSCFTPSWLIEVRRFLEDHGFAHFEEPCPYWELDWTKEGTDALDIDATGASKPTTSRINAGWR